ncbi:MAG: IS21 family transposase [Pseudomonadota bacterium]|nr:IS21 family transposase [Pseudomonadota bacterium]
MDYRKTHTQALAAAKAGLSERTARRIDSDEHYPAGGKRTWRTRPDPLTNVWEPIVLPLLKQIPDLPAIDIFEHLCEFHPDKFDTRSRRTLERRVNHWRQLHGPDLMVTFPQEHFPGEQGIADFTVVESPVTVAGEPAPHRLFHYRLTYSGWAFAEPVWGGESYTALASGLSRAYQASDGVPKEQRTDSLSAAYKNRQEQDDFTSRYEQFCKHYNVKATRNNRGQAHENGAIESPHGHLKPRIERALQIRGSYDFESRQAYAQFIAQIVARHNRRIASAFKVEQRQLQPLPSAASVNYTEEHVRVSRTSTIMYKRVTYTVPSRLKHARVLLRAFDDRLELYCSGIHTLTLERLFARNQERLHSVNYRHLIESLVKKPRALRHYRWRDELIPEGDYQYIWQWLEQHHDPDRACHLMVRLLHLAHKSDQEQALGRYVLAEISRGQFPCLIQCEKRFLDHPGEIPIINVNQHALSQYSVLITQGAAA